MMQSQHRIAAVITVPTTLIASFPSSAAILGWAVAIVGCAAIDRIRTWGDGQAFTAFTSHLAEKSPGSPPNPLDEILASICCKSARRYTAPSHSHPLRFASISWHLLRDLLKGVPAKRASMVENFNHG